MGETTVSAALYTTTFLWFRRSRLLYIYNSILPKNLAGRVLLILKFCNTAIIILRVKCKEKHRSPSLYQRRKSFLRIHLNMAMGVGRRVDVLPFTVALARTAAVVGQKKCAVQDRPRPVGFERHREGDVGGLR